ncbi:MAG: RloB domain-containing protein [Planctomycetaceae bacterium]|nr:RloB domain-containing protein [Planctomycetaceae bacterium]
MRKKRPLERTESTMRDTRLVVIASEDRYAVKQYFEFFRSTRIQFRVLETTDGCSSPQDVMDRLDEYLEEYDIGEGDQFWLVCDTDHWIEPSHIQNLTEINRRCRQMGIGFSLNNPCFDLWLLLHFAEFPSEDKLTCQEIGELMRSELGGFDKTKIYNLPIDNAKVAQAIESSKANYTGAEIPTQLQTSIHLIIEDLIERKMISIESGA